MNIDVSPSCALVNDKYCLIALADAAITILIFKGFVVEMDYTRGVLHVERCQLKRHHKSQLLFQNWMGDGKF